MSERLLEVEGLRVEVPGVGDIVDDVSFGLDAAEVIGLVGESGSGKSTIGLALLGHTRRGARITAGTVTIDGLCREAEKLGLAEALSHSDFNI